MLSRGVDVCCRRCSCHRAASGCCGTAAGPRSTMPPTWATPGQSLGDDDHRDNSDKELVSPLVMMITVIRNWSVSYNSDKEWVTPGQSLSDDDNSDKELVSLL